MNIHERLLCDTILAIIVLVEPTQLQIVMANQEACQTLGYTEETLRAMTITDIESSLQDVFYWEDVRNGQYLDIDGQEGLYQCADGSMLTVIKSVRVVDHQGSPLLLVQARDVQKDRQAEDALEQTLSQLRARL